MGKNKNKKAKLDPVLESVRQDSVDWVTWIQSVHDLLSSATLAVDTAQSIEYLLETIPATAHIQDPALSDEACQFMVQKSTDIQAYIQKLHIMALKKFDSQAGHMQRHQARFIKQLYGSLVNSSFKFDSAREALESAFLHIIRNMSTLASLIRMTTENSTAASHVRPSHEEVVARVTEAFSDELNSIRVNDDLSRGQLQILAEFIGNTLCDGLEL